MHAVIASADALDEPVIVLLGHTDYYPRFGFEPGEAHAIHAPDPSWGAHFQVRPLSSCPPQLSGHFRYSAPFEDL